ncbi:MAG: hypothetical protein AVDCRST_MAG40-2681, partial [uncultured Gemmatimonadaceae bacterium]
WLAPPPMPTTVEASDHSMSRAAWAQLDLGLSGHAAVCFA